jgi:myo-inositol-1(or 4)-monophosphatase
MERDLTEARDLAASLAEEAGRLQVERRANLQIRAPKAHANDFLSDVDIASERLIVAGIAKAWPDDTIHAEEGHGRRGTSGWTWMVDPLDGTRNYISRTGPWSVCIALYHGDDAQVAVVHDPVARETFSGLDDRGAFLHDTPISAAPGAPLEQALTGLSFNPSRQTKDRVARLMRVLLPAIGDVRRIPSGLNLAYLAAGRLECGVVLDAKAWDVAAGTLIARQAGVSLAGEGPQPGPGLTIGATPPLWQEFSELLRSALSN